MKIEPPKPEKLKSYHFSEEDRVYSYSSGNHSHHAILAASEHFGQGYKEYLYTASRTLPYSPSYVWHILTRSELWNAWMLGHSDKPWTPLPPQFGAGSEVYGFDKEYDFDTRKDVFKRSAFPSAIVIDGKQGVMLRLRCSNIAGDTMYVDARLSSGRRGQTIVTFELRYFHKDTSTAIGRGLASLFGQKDEEPEGHRREYNDKAEHFLKEFSNLCHEIDRYGFVRNHHFGDKEIWFDWWHYQGKLVLYPDANGNRTLEPGSIIESGEKLGYIYSPQHHSSEQYAQENYYIAVGSEPGNKFRIVDSIVQDGDMIEKYDRLFLWEWVS